MFIGIKIAPRLLAGFSVVLLALLAVWGIAALEITNTIAALAGNGATPRGARTHDLVASLEDALGLVHAIGAAAVLVSGLMLWALSHSITRPLAKAVRAIELVASGDLTHTAAVASKDEIGRLFGAIHGMRQNLGALVAEVLSSAEQVAHGNAQIAHGHGELAQRTEDQASTLEQTAAAMEELTATVGRNAENARAASQLATGASSVAHEAGEVVNQVLGTMASIDQDSRRIADIVGVMDGIAFQTNLLALNAAVEAARAGGQGRGFAVVAAEVRQLAQRSATAAREIKTLIGAAAEKRALGSRLANQAGETMQKVVASVKSVTGLMADIARASQEQSAGIDQVSAGITGMERVVQQNGAMVEEAAAATDALEERAKVLLAMVARFKLGKAPVTVVEAAQPLRAVAA